MTHVQLAAAFIVTLTIAGAVSVAINGQWPRSGRRSALGRYRYLRRHTKYSRRAAWRIARRPALSPWRP